MESLRKPGLYSPVLLVFAGPNGSGKSTITEGIPTVGLYVNADEIKKAKQCSDLAAAQEAEQIREYCLENQVSFTFETVLSTPRNLNLLERAHGQGFAIKGIFVLTCDPLLNAARVMARVAEGGHDVPHEKIISRYHRALANVPRFINVCDECYIFDNTEKPEIIFEKSSGKTTIHENHYWLTGQIKALIKQV
jgi:predicted ABC-type ATPase